ncbi:hypothetical protein DPMN_097409 [Dreissena polymorpha]|uniref:Uncharacterized protein n=1 Tax=Dreissena polymorpha TaxID=45954 RepID=A0A9D4R4J4_DREPO|nr:hypothetical protein DPMN_097409 [Dreissena polymorpha]
MKESNWRLKSVIRLEINTVTYKSLKGKSYIPLPGNYCTKNEDDECFKNVNARVFTDGGQRTILKPHLSNQAKNVTSKVKTAPPPWRPYIYKTNLFTKFHDDWANNVCSRVHVIQLNGTIFELNFCINETNVLTKFHENWAKNVTSRVFTYFHYIHKEKNAPPTGGIVFSPIWTILKLIRDINKTNVLNNFHDDWAKIMTSRVFTRKIAPPTGGHVFHRTETTFELNQHIIKANILTKFHERWAKNVTSRVFTCFHYIHIEKNAPPTNGHVFSPIWTILKLVRDINKTNVLINFHDDWAKIVTSRVFTRKTAPPTGGHVFQRTRTTFELNQQIIKANILTHFEHDRDIIGTNLLTKFHEDRK